MLFSRHQDTVLFGWLAPVCPQQETVPDMFTLIMHIMAHSLTKNWDKGSLTLFKNNCLVWSSIWEKFGKVQVDLFANSKSKDCQL